MNQDILTLIQENMSSFSKGQKRIAGFILHSYDKAAFMTASRLGQQVHRFLGEGEGDSGPLHPVAHPLQHPPGDLPQILLREPVEL